jgi:hypothetical protein
MQPLEVNRECRSSDQKSKILLGNQLLESNPDENRVEPITPRKPHEGYLEQMNSLSNEKKGIASLGSKRDYSRLEEPVEPIEIKSRLILKDGKASKLSNDPELNHIALTERIKNLEINCSRLTNILDGIRKNGPNQTQNVDEFIISRLMERKNSSEKSETISSKEMSNPEDVILDNVRHLFLPFFISNKCIIKKKKELALLDKSEPCTSDSSVNLTSDFPPLYESAEETSEREEMRTESEKKKELKLNSKKKKKEKKLRSSTIVTRGNKSKK